MKTTQNIPTELPIRCCESETEEILDWIRNRPVDDKFDGSMSPGGRWLFTIQDCGMYSKISVEDTSFGVKYEVRPSNPDTW